MIGREEGLNALGKESEKEKAISSYNLFSHAMSNANNIGSSAHITL